MYIYIIDISSPYSSNCDSWGVLAAFAGSGVQIPPSQHLPGFHGVGGSTVPIHSDSPLPDRFPPCVVTHPTHPPFSIHQAAGFTRLSVGTGSAHVPRRPLSSPPEPLRRCPGFRRVQEPRWCELLGLCDLGASEVTQLLRKAEEDA